MAAQGQHMHGVEELCALLFYSPITFSCRPAPSWINVIFAFRGANQKEYYYTVPKVVISTFKRYRIQKYVFFIIIRRVSAERKDGWGEGTYTCSSF